jgi:hypothetical protein
MDHQENRDFMREYKCKAKRILSKKMKWARIPDEFQNVTINSFDISLYPDQASKEKSSPGTKVSWGLRKGMENGIELGKESAIYYFASRFDNLDKVKGIGPETIKLVVEHCGEQYFKTID